MRSRAIYAFGGKILTGERRAAVGALDIVWLGHGPVGGMKGLCLVGLATFIRIKLERDLLFNA